MGYTCGMYHEQYDVVGLVFGDIYIMAFAIEGNSKITKFSNVYTMGFGDFGGTGIPFQTVPGERLKIIYYRRPGTLPSSDPKSGRHHQEQVLCMRLEPESDLQQPSLFCQG